MAEAVNLAAELAARTNRLAACILCQGQTRIRDHLPHLWHQRDSSGSYDIRWCDACEFGFLDPRPSLADLARFAADTRRLHRDWPEMIPSRPTFLEKVRIRIAWQFSHAGAHSTITVARVEEFGGTRPASICMIGAWGTLLSDLLHSGHEVVAIAGDETERAEIESHGATVHDGSIEAPPAGIPARRSTSSSLADHWNDASTPALRSKRRTAS